VGAGAGLSVGRVYLCTAAQEVLLWAQTNGCPWDGSTYADLLAAEVVAAATAATAATVAEAARQAAQTVQVLLGTMVSMAVAAAVEAMDTWHTSSHTGLLFLLILLVRPVVLVLLDSYLFYLVRFLVGSLGVIDVEPFLALAPRERRLVILSILLVLLFVVDIFKILFRVSIIVLIHFLFCILLPKLGRGGCSGSTPPLTDRP